VLAPGGEEQHILSRRGETKQKKRKLVTDGVNRGI
jgi:hypothetical protein